MNTLIPNRNPDADTDPAFDALLGEAIQERVVVTQDAPRHGRPRFEWAKYSAVVVCAVLGTLLLGGVLENLRTASLPPAISAPTPAPVQPARPLDVSHVVITPHALESYHHTPKLVHWPQ